MNGIADLVPEAQPEWIRLAQGLLNNPVSLAGAFQSPDEDIPQQIHLGESYTAMALTLDGTTRWPSAKELKRLGETSMGSTPAKVRQILQKMDGAIGQTMIEIRAYIRQHAEFAEIGGRMLQEWETGSTRS